MVLEHEHKVVEHARAAIPTTYRAAVTAMFALAILGFAKTFTLRSVWLAHAEPLPAHLVVHGVALTAWFTLLFVQLVLMTKGRRRLHRWLGWAGAVVAASVVGSTGVATFHLIPRHLAAGETMAEHGRHLSGVVWGNLSQLAVFAGLFAWALVWRRRPLAHIRLMLIASLTLLLPALSRLGRLVDLHDAVLPVVGACTLLAAMVREERQHGGVSVETRWGFAALFIIVSAAAAVGATPPGQWVTQAMLGVAP